MSKKGKSKSICQGKEERTLYFGSSLCRGIAAERPEGGEGAIAIDAGKSQSITTTGKLAMAGGVASMSMRVIA